MPQRPDLTELATEVATEVAHRARDAAYVAVGLGVLGIQRAQVRRHELAKRAGPVDDRMAYLRKAIAAGVEQVDGWLDATVQLLESSIEPLGDQLPAPAKDLAGKACEGVRELRAQLRQLGGALG